MSNFHLSYKTCCPFTRVKLGFHIVISDRDASQSVDRRCCWDAYDDMGTFLGDVADGPRSISDVPVERGKVEISSAFENVPDASASCPRRCWDVPVTYDDMQARFKGTCHRPLSKRKIARVNRLKTNVTPD